MTIAKYDAWRKEYHPMALMNEAMAEAAWIAAYKEGTSDEREQALAAQPAPVPLAHIVGEIDHTGKVWTPAAQRTWMGLVMDEDDECTCKADKTVSRSDFYGWRQAYRQAIEAKLKEKNT
jgi:hypothetical protein